jgi:O-antigen/teichoic acid export membrane protein
VLALFTSLGAFGLIIGVVFGETLATSILSADVRKHCRRLVPDFSFWASVRKNIHTYRNFPLYTAPYSFVGVFSKRALFLILSVYATTYEVGLFAIATRFTRLPAGIISAAIKPVFFQKAAKELGSPNFERLVIRILTLQMVAATPMLVFFLFNARWICGIVFGDSWADAGTYATWLALPAFMLLFATWPDRIYDVLGRQRLALFMEVIYDIISIVLFTLTLAWLESVEIAVGLYSSVSAIYYLFWLIVTFRIANFSTAGLWRLGAVFVGMFCVALTVHWGAALLFTRIGAIVTYIVLMVFYYVFLGIKYGRALTVASVEGT